MRHIIDIRHLWLRRVVKAHAAAFLVFLGTYVVLAVFDPGLLSYDMRQKFRVLADETIAVTATVLDVPAQPVVTGTADCNETTGILSVSLDWVSDVNSYTYDIDRESLSLVTGLTNSAYSDTNVVVATTYEYVVTARGPMGPGFATSAPVSVMTPAECEITAAPPAVTIVSFAGRGVDSYNGTPRVENRRPLFTGTTSMPNASMLVNLGSDLLVQFTANANGYWEWRPPYNIGSGRQTFTVTATDPNDDTRHATATLRFDILKNDTRSDDSNNTDIGTPRSIDIPTSSSGSSSVNTGELSAKRPVNFTLRLGNQEQSVFQGSELKILIEIRGLLEKYTHISIPIRYSLTDKNYETLFSETRETTVFEGAMIHDTLLIPPYVRAGEYFLRIELFFDELSVSQLLPVFVKELPLIQLSSGGAISYADIIRNIGWIAFVFFLLFLVWLLLFIREFALYLRSDRVVSEYDLKKAGFIRR